MFAVFVVPANPFETPIPIPGSYCSENNFLFANVIIREEGPKYRYGLKDAHNILSLLIEKPCSQHSRLQFICYSSSIVLGWPRQYRSKLCSSPFSGMNHALRTAISPCKQMKALIHILPVMNIRYKRTKPTHVVERKIY